MRRGSASHSVIPRRPAFLGADPGKALLTAPSLPWPREQKSSNRSQRSRGTVFTTGFIICATPWEEYGFNGHFSDNNPGLSEARWRCLVTGCDLNPSPCDSGSHSLEGSCLCPTPIFPILPQDRSYKGEIRIPLQGIESQSWFFADKSFDELQLLQWSW